MTVSPTARWVDTLDTISNYLSLTATSAGEATPVTVDVECPYDLDVFEQFYIG